ncbi:putative RND superfamily exporter protein [Paenibacillus forsythiae]|uniref:RND superfamily exporter protein n=1 Tax=Paenibacillus forsythiae TaxID=365616 RepID=A0ABU3H763_9BACL|nr:hypothetical protein [Paenibacillus forsythiae]MDT3426672.1 putative RND superfamily exporter protein [Paenibacillus forsythiae]
MKLKTIIIAFSILLLTACNSFDVEEVTSDADKAFESKDLAAFNTDIQKLKDEDSKEYDTYLTKIKESDTFNIDSYQNYSDINSGLSYITKISKEVPELKEYAEKSIDSFNTRKVYFESLNESIFYIIHLHVETINSLVSKSNTSAIIFYDSQRVDDVVSELNLLSSFVNSDIISLKALKAPEKLTTQHNEYIESLKKYKLSLDAKSTYISRKKPQINSSNSLLKEGKDIFAKKETSDMYKEIENLSSDVITALNDVKQRAEILQTFLQLKI